MKKEIYEKITKKKEYSRLPKKDVELAWNHFKDKQTSEEEKIKLTRKLLRKVYGSFLSNKFLVVRERSSEWVLKKHISTRDRFKNYPELYPHLLKNFKEKVCIFDLGAGVNGFSFDFLKKINNKIRYLGIEGVGQLVDLTNYYFKKKGIKNAKLLHLSLFELEKIKKILNSIKGKKICFLFKVLDSLEMLEKNYSKKILKQISNSCDMMVISFAIKSLISGKRFKVTRKWILTFILENFEVIDDFELGDERYIIFKNI